MKEKITQSLLDEMVSKAIRKKNILGAVICVEKGDQSLSLISGGGNIQAEDFYFIASVTKLYITAIMLKLRSQHHLQLEDRISGYLSTDIINQIHVLDGIDYSNDITIKHLMSNTSGIPDYFTSDVVSDLVNGNDQSWHLEKTLEVIKRKKPKFKPGQKGKAQYSDLNYQLLGKIIENITGLTIHTVFKQFIFDELNLEKTYVYEDVNDSRPISLFHKKQPLNIPIYMTSISPEGGIVSNARETMVFLRAFFNGQLFPREDLSELTAQWRLLFGPGLFYYGTGISRQPITALNLKKGLIGHWGQSGAFAFYHQDSDLYFTGTVNQFTGHAAAARMMMKLIKTIPY